MRNVGIPLLLYLFLAVMFFSRLAILTLHHDNLVLLPEPEEKDKEQF